MEQESRNPRPSYMDTPPGETRRDDVQRNPAASDTASTLGGLRPSRYDDDDRAPAAANRFASPPPRENGAHRAPANPDADRYKPAPAASTFGAPEDKAKNPLLRSETSMRRFSWEDSEPAKPAARPSAPARDYEPPRYEPRSPRLDEVGSSVPEPRSYGAERAEPSRYDAPRANPAPRQAPAYQPPPRQQTYRDEPYANDGYYEAEPRQAYDGYADDAYQGVHSRQLADVDHDYAREYSYQAEGAELNQGYGDYDYDYQQFEQPYGEYPGQKPRSRAPIIILGALLGMVVLAVAGWIIFNSFSPSSSTGENIPVVTPDDTRVKVPETAKVEPTAPAPPQKTKLIYDRIRSEDAEPENTLVPREEQPADPDNRSDNFNAPADNETSVTPASDTQSTDGTEPLPLPLPPPPVDSSQNNAIQPSFNTTSENLNRGGQEVAANQNEPPAPATNEVLRTTSDDQTATDTSSDAPASLTRLIQSPPLPRDKPVPPSRQADPGPALPTGPIQIAPLPGSVERDAEPVDQATNDQTAPTPTQPEQIQPQAQPERQVAVETSPRFGNRFENDDIPGSTPRRAPQQDTQVAVVQPEAPTAPAPQISGGRYVIQLAAFGSEAEAQDAFNKARAKHPSLLGSYTSIIQQADLGSRGTYYRLFVGPLETRSDASQLCNSLIAAGERDCLVRER